MTHNDLRNGNGKSERDEEVTKVHVHMKTELYDLIEAEAARSNLARYEVLTMLAAKHFERPDLAFIPKGKRGPKGGKRKRARRGA